MITNIKELIPPKGYSIDRVVDDMSEAQCVSDNYKEDAVATISRRLSNGRVLIFRAEIYE